jgi:hypothetical protein
MTRNAPGSWRRPHSHHHPVKKIASAVSMRLNFDTRRRFSRSSNDSIHFAAQSPTRPCACRGLPSYFTGASSPLYDRGAFLDPSRLFGTNLANISAVHSIARVKGKRFNHNASWFTYNLVGQPNGAGHSPTLPLKSSHRLERLSAAAVDEALVLEGQN